ncbi:hypothetical protein UPYG_G00067190 [Umbra pygmaea]|uniref:Uncharacterized protein n=1 Tax=Umbra pygmaea TaxID=75934 RepID=A0ABD0XAQ4_UMBPY
MEELQLLPPPGMEELQLLPPPGMEELLLLPPPGMEDLQLLPPPGVEELQLLPPPGMEELLLLGGEFKPPAPPGREELPFWGEELRLPPPVYQWHRHTYLLCPYCWCRLPFTRGLSSLDAIAAVSFGGPLFSSWVRYPPSLFTSWLLRGRPLDCGGGLPFGSQAFGGLL